MTSPRQRMARADRRTQLIDCAELVFVAGGFAASSMEDVAGQAGVTKPVLYDHFGSKDGLLAAVVSRLGTRMLAATQGAANSGQPPEIALSQGLVAYFRFVDRHAGSWLLLLREVAPGSAAADEVERIRKSQVEMIGSLVAAHQAIPDAMRAYVYAHVVSGAAERLAAERVMGKRISAVRAAELLMEVLWQGFERLREDAS